MSKRFALACLVTGLVASSPAHAQERTITVFAAASLKNAIDDTNAAFTKATGIKVVVSYAGTSALVKQIEAGAPADVFLSADLRWMDYVAGKKLIKPQTRVNLLGNTLVLIARDPVQDQRGDDRARFRHRQARRRWPHCSGRRQGGSRRPIRQGRVGVAGAWPAAEKKLAQAENVRAALAYVSRGEAPLGIVYATDAKIDKGVKIVGTFPEASHPPVTYPVAATVSAKPEAARYLSFLRTSGAKRIFEAFGFSYLIRPTS